MYGEFKGTYKNNCNRDLVDLIHLHLPGIVGLITLDEKDMKTTMAFREYPFYVHVPIYVPEINEETHESQSSLKIPNVKLYNKNLYDFLKLKSWTANCIYFDYYGTIFDNKQIDHYPARDINLYLRKNKSAESIVAFTFSNRSMRHAARNKADQDIDGFLNNLFKKNKYQADRLMLRKYGHALNRVFCVYKLFH